MSDSFRKLSRVDYAPSADRKVSDDVLKLGALLRIADATELMAKRHDELVRARVAAEANAKYYQDLYRSTDRRLSASRGQITKLKKLLAEKTAKEQA